MQCFRWFALAALVLVACGLAPLPAQQSDKKPIGLVKRTPWTTSRITGAPEPPPPYRTERAFEKLTFKNPVLLTTAPGSNRFFVAEQRGKLFSFKIDPNVDKADLVIDLAKDIQSFDKSKVRGVGEFYGVAFHPRFAKNRFCYLMYILTGKSGDLPEGSRIARFVMENTDPPRIDPKTEKIIYTWPSGGHNGCDIHFGPDGFLYISTGDGAGPNPPDALDAGQDLTRPFSKILRIDVDREENGKPYAIPPDNPFVKTPGARPETWAYGFRNPWRMSFDRKTGDLWVGDVGWEQWEMIYRIQKGGNYGWSVMEGSQVVRPEAKRGPTPILPPALALPHTESASITGGYVYRGKRLKELEGVYICGDWVTRKIWGTRFDGDKIVWHKELAIGNERVVAFGEDHDKDLYFVHHEENGSIHRLAPNEAVKTYRGDFPKQLSETGLFSSVKEHVVAPGVVPFSINAERWADHATAERFVALPGTSTVKIYDSRLPWPDYNGEVFFPKDGVLAKTLTLEMERGNPKSKRRLETQILHFDGVMWKGYSYAWNDEQTDASLVPVAGMDRTVTVIDSKAPGKKREQRWHYPSRTECLTCHNPWAGYTLAFNVPQLNRVHDFGYMVVSSQLPMHQRMDLVRFVQRAKGSEVTQLAIPTQRVPALGNPATTLDDRARAYLHVNCAHCHQFGGGGTANIDLRYSTKLEQTNLVDVRPVQGTFEIAGAHLLSPSDPYRSVLYYRMAKLGPGRMPHIGSEVIDEAGLRLIRDWVRSIHPSKDERAMMDKLRSARPDERPKVIAQLLQSTTSAMMLANAVGEGQISEQLRGDVLKAAMALSNSQVRDLFERFVPEDQRTKRLGSAIKPAQILERTGNAERGRELFFKSAGLQCANCHRINGNGSTLGPDLSDIGKQKTRAQILESILEPSKFVDPKYVAYLVETNDGKVLTGLLASKNDKEIVLKLAGDKEARVPASTVATLAPQQKSLMPELLLRDVTLEQAADLLEFLAGLK